MDLENMSKEELISILKNFYAKLAKPIPDKPNFIVGRYYRVEQTGEDDIEVSIDNMPKGADVYQYVIWMSFDEAKEYFPN